MSVGSGKTPVTRERREKLKTEIGRFLGLVEPVGLLTQSTAGTHTHKHTCTHACTLTGSHTDALMHTCRQTCTRTLKKINVKHHPWLTLDIWGLIPLATQRTQQIPQTGFHNPAFFSLRTGVSSIQGEPLPPEWPPAACQAILEPWPVAGRVLDSQRGYSGLSLESKLLEGKVG